MFLHCPELNFNIGGRFKLPKQKQSRRNSLQRLHKDWTPKCPKSKARIILVPVAVALLALHLAETADGLGLLTCLLLRRLFVVAAQLHLAEKSLALHLFLQNAQRLIDIVILDTYCNQRSSLL